MTKGLLTLYVDNEIKEIAKQKGINLSSFFNNVLSVEINQKTPKKDEVQKLKNKIALLTDSLKKSKKEIEKIKKEKIKAKKRYINTGISLNIK